MELKFCETYIKNMGIFFEKVEKETKLLYNNPQKQDMVRYGYKMYAELRMELECDGLNYRQSSNLQGVIMENIAREYAEKLHGSSLNPYSQCIIRENEKNIWHIRTMTEEAYEKLLLPLSRISEFKIKDGKMHAEIRKKRIEITEEETLLREFYEQPGLHFLDIRFQTPTAFKCDGRYIFYPNIHLFYQSLMAKYTAASDKLDMIDSDTLEQLEKNSEISGYRLQTIRFPLEKVQITGFTGGVRIHIKGTDTMARYVRLLVRFGYYSGVGIKTAIGMGAVMLKEQGEKNDRS